MTTHTRRPRLNTFEALNTLQHHFVPRNPHEYNRANIRWRRLLVVLQHYPAGNTHQQPMPSPLANNISNGAENCSSPMCGPSIGPPQPTTANTHAKTHSLPGQNQAHAPYSTPTSPPIPHLMFGYLRSFAEGNPAGPSSLCGNQYHT